MLKLPWWLTVLLGLALYALCTWLLPQVKTENETLASFCAAAPQLAPILSIPLLLLGAKQLYDIPSADAGVAERDEEDL